MLLKKYKDGENPYLIMNKEQEESFKDEYSDSEFISIMGEKYNYLAVIDDDDIMDDDDDEITNEYYRDVDDFAAANIRIR